MGDWYVRMALGKDDVMKIKSLFSKAGFTLVEIMLVVIIIGALAAKQAGI